MSGESAAGTLVEIKLKQLERAGRAVDEVARKELYDSIRASYTEQMKPQYGAARLWIDKIIDPAETRQALAWALAAAHCNPIMEKFSVGILQT